ncbi:MAG: DUF1553 domain-containing protein [Verrucomicrobiota bacterium]
MLLAVSLIASRAAEKVDVSKLPPTASAQVDFAKDIQPLFAEHCYKCHGVEKQKSDFRLDIKSAAFKGGELGQDIIPGKSAQSRLIHLVAGLVEDMRMPPKGDPLTTEQIALLRAWIDQGAHWPDGIDRTKLKDKRDHWAFQPAARPALPEVKNKSWVRNPIDQFILARLEKEGLAPSHEADRRTLLRRLHYDLTGLPPTPSDLEAFLNDRSAEAWERLIERLLSSPRYGERWGRHWLDVVHYGESHGYDKDKPRLNAWPYRDYVIRAFNEDKPYSRFILEQIAGDVLFPEDPQGVVATGFIAAGPWDFVGHVELPESKTDGLIARYNDRDDMVMTTMSTFLSLTVHCARCHDHKFDPISQEEYYRLQAVFAGVDRADRFYDDDPGIFVQRRQLLAEKRALEQRRKAIDEIVAKITSPEIEQLDARLKEVKKHLAALPKSAKESPSNGYHSGIETAPDVEKWVQVDLIQPRAIDEIKLIPARPTDFPDTPGFGFPKRFRVEISDDEEFKTRQVLADYGAADFPNPGNEPVALAGRGERARFVRVTATRLWERTKDYFFALAELQVFSGTNNVARRTRVSALDTIEAGRWARNFLVDNYDSRKKLFAEPEPPDIEAKRKALTEEIDGLTAERKSKVEALLDAETKAARAEVAERLNRVEEHLKPLPQPQWVYAAADDFPASGNFKPAGGPRTVHLLQRGDVKRALKPVAPGALQCVPGLEGELPLEQLESEGNRRAALARWIADPKNLLARRSIANRVWQFHFGKGLVDSPNDFGHMGSAPSHPELLDWLAFWFLDHGESIKELHRLILSSATYRQVSTERPEEARVDGDNRFLWRMNRLRLDAESVRDSILFVSGKLDLKMGGPSVQQFYFKDDHSPVYDYTRFDVDSPGSARRSVYRFIVRSVPDPMMDCMDFADPSLLTPKRNVTLTALQALTLLNDPFFVRQAEHFAARLAASGSDLRGQIELAFRLALCRPPTTEESAALRNYAEQFGMPNLCRVIFNSNEFLFVD